MSDPLAEVDWTKEETKALKSFLEGHKFAMIHCDEQVDPKYGLCECMLRLAEWWVEQRAVKG